MKRIPFKFWQLLALVSGSIIALAMALASISYNATLGSTEPAFAFLPITNRDLFSALALAFDLGMVASVFGFWHWRARNKTAALLSAGLFVIASVFSVHSVRGYIALNLTKAEAPAARDHDVYASLKRDLEDAQEHLSSLRASLVRARGRERLRIEHEIDEQVHVVDGARARLVNAEIDVHVSPMQGAEWFIAITLWFFNASCWTAWFGSNRAPVSTSSNTSTSTQMSTCSDSELKEDARARDDETVETLPHDDDGVRTWLLVDPQPEPEHCVRLYERYCAWFADTNHTPISDRRFYARLIALGARKFRLGRNGPMHYDLSPCSTAIASREDDRLEA